MRISRHWDILAQLYSDNSVQTFLIFFFFFLGGGGGGGGPQKN